MITSCPSCHTYFRVYEQQLAARAGQVRCGKCGRVFDALEYLAEDIAPPRASRSTPEIEIARAEPGGAGSASDLPAAEAAELDAEAQNSETAQDPGIHAQAPESRTEMPRDEIEQGSEDSAAMFETAATAGANAFDFGPVAGAKPAKRTRRWPWLLGAVLSLCVLFAQAAYYYRSAITLLFPETKPYAAVLCARLGCELSLPRRAELLSIEASDLQADTTNPNVMVLSATLKNRAVFSQQHPLLELTLTDAQDQPLVRRVLTPQDYVGKAVGLQAGFAANTEIGIKVFIEGSQVKATGYRLYLFYP